MAQGGLAAEAGIRLFAVMLVFQIIAIVAVILRVWAKQVRERKFQLHDYMIFASLVFDIGFTVIVCIAVVDGGVGLHLPAAEKTLGMKGLETALKAFFASTFVWMTATTFAKVSILLFYVQIFEKRSFKIAAWIIGLISVLYCIAYYLTNFLYCRPFAYNWDKTIPDGHCTNVTVNEITSATINMVVDLAIVILPMPVLWQLQMPFEKKAFLSVVLSFGLVICAMNLARIYFEATENAEDVTYALINAGLFAGLEVHIGILCACMPTFGPLILREGLVTRIRRAKPYPIEGDSERALNTIGGSSRTKGQSSGRVNRAYERMDDDDILLSQYSSSKDVSKGL